ncbi:MAG: polysaccharide biosynthesis tyrosine autokinase [Acidobacteriota bacterium]|nr:polysaccharide biosynthesis tyrosine autokinase [Acidobacteriota bacterium]MDH3784164.1 polysaccharide biosynthesis tyrosine autokinase [Acidobacteriota bacterium]
MTEVTSSSRPGGQLFDYWRVLVQRRGVIATCAAVALVATGILSFLATPSYTATTTIEIERQSPEILEFTDVLGVDPAGYKDFYQTQHRILQSHTVLRLAAEETDLIHHPSFVERKGSPLSRGIGVVRSWLGSTPENRNPQDPAIDFIRDGLRVSPIRSSHLVRIAMVDRDPSLAAELSNAVASAYQRFQMDARYDTTGKAKEFLTKDVARVQGEVLALERQLQAYGADKRIFGLGENSDNISEQALADLNVRVTEARGRLAGASARDDAVREADPEALPEVLNSPVISHLSQQNAGLERRYAQMAERFGPSWPTLVELREELSQSRTQLSRQSADIASQVRAAAGSELGRAATELENLERERTRQENEVQRIRGVTIEYAGLQRQIETKRKVLASLVERQSETETSYRLKDTSTSNIRVVDLAEPPRSPTSPRKAMNMLIALFLGAAIGCGMAFLIDHIDNSVKDENELARVSGFTVYGHVPVAQPLRLVDNAGTGSGAMPTTSLDMASHLDPRSGFAEAFRNLRTALLLAAPDHPPRHVVVTSSEPMDGKSTVAQNLAIVLTQLGRDVLLVDADMRRPRLHKTLETPNDVGLSSLLSGNAPLDGLIQNTAIPRLSALPSGPIPPNPSELLGSPGLQAMLVELGDRFDHVIFDAPPVLSVTDSVILSTRMDSTLVVVRSGVTSRDALAQSAARLSQSRSNTIGAVLNAVSHESNYYYGRYGRSGGDGRYEEDPQETGPTDGSRAAG